MPATATAPPESATAPKAPTIEIRALKPGEDATAFRTLNEEWITSHFVLEPKDIETLNHPEATILNKGGHIFIVYADSTPVGCVALIPIPQSHGVYELSKMAVAPSMRGLGIGRKLLEHTVEQARILGARSLFLGSSTKLKNAVHLYESIGFRHVDPATLPDMHYSRADVFMEMPAMSAASLAPAESALSYNQAMQLRLATRDDIPAIMRIVRAVVPLMRATGNLQWDDTYPNPAAFEEDIAHDHLWVSAIDEEIAGVIALTEDQSPEYVQAGWDITEPAIVVHRLAVNPEFQGQGIAAALLLQADAVAHERRIPRIRADTNTHNQAMQRLLPKLGYALSGEISLDFRPGMRFLCYEKLLP